ncbi:hypothetical protein IAR50_003817 [Cryptococcus sp. DSM 104548]
MSHIPPDLSLHDAFSLLPPEVRAIIHDIVPQYSLHSTRSYSSGLRHQKLLRPIHPELYKSISLDQRKCGSFFYHVVSETDDPEGEVLRYCEDMLANVKPTRIRENFGQREWEILNHPVTFISNPVIRKLTCLSCGQKVTLNHTDAIAWCKEEKLPTFHTTSTSAASARIFRHTSAIAGCSPRRSG